MMIARSSADDARVLHEAASRTMARLGLSGFDNASIAQADAWIDSEEFRAHWSIGSLAAAHEVAAYLGEAIIRRHGGSWSFGANAPYIRFDRNGRHVISPFSKVQKRAQNGREHHLLGLVHLAEHLAKTPVLDPHSVTIDAHQALALGQADAAKTRGWRATVLLVFALVVFPLTVLVGLFCTVDMAYALIGGGIAIPLGLVGALALARSQGASPLPGTLAWEAQLSIPPLEARLVERLDALDSRHASQDALAEIAFYSAQLRELHAIVARRDPSLGRGFIGFDSYARGRVSSWIRTRSP